MFTCQTITKPNVYTGVGKSRLIVVCMQKQFILILFTLVLYIFHMNNCIPTSANPCILNRINLLKHTKLQVNHKYIMLFENI